MTEKSDVNVLDQDSIDQVWYETLADSESGRARAHRRFNMFLPGEPRCAHCGAPFGGVGGLVFRIFKKIEPSGMNPRYCNDCELFAKNYPGGAEVDLAMVFVDVRGSTGVAEGMSPREFTRLIDLFHKQATRILIHSDALVEKMVGDQLAGLYVPGYAGADYGKRALGAALELQTFLARSVSEGKGLPVGIGVHTGRAYVGAVGSKESIIEITALGDDVNLAARLCQMAGPGEIVVSGAVFDETPFNILSERKISNTRLVPIKGRQAKEEIRIISMS